MIMKKIIFAIALVMTMALSANAQRDGFFSDYSNGLDREQEFGIVLPSSIGMSTGPSNDINAPLGSGLLVLTALGAGYAMARRKREE